MDWRLGLGLTVFLLAACGPDLPGEPAPFDTSWIPVVPEPPAPEPLDVFEQLSAIEGLSVVEGLSDNPGYRSFQLELMQPADHQDPGGATFAHRMILLHKDVDAPMVLHATGYTLFEESYGDYLAEPTVALAANQLLVEHRYFPGSRPADADWRHMNVEQAAADHHEIVRKLGAVYAGRWIGTGWSKGGMTVLFHERFYPSDLDGVLAYVAPISYDAPDKRYVPHLAQLGPADCRADLEAMQRDALLRLAELTDLYQQYAPARPRRAVRDAVVDGVVSFEWMFWQYWGVDYCAILLPPGSNAEDFLQLLPVDVYGPDPLAPEPETAAYAYQAATELGYPANRTEHLEDLIPADHLPADPNALPGAPWGDEELVHDRAVMRDIGAWLLDQGEDVIAIYGEYDPWTGGRIDLDARLGSHVVIAPGATHGASLAALSGADQGIALERLAQLADVEPQLTLARSDALRLAGARHRRMIIETAPEHIRRLLR